MNVQITAASNVIGVALVPGQVRQIPDEYFNAATMTRIGIDLTSATRSALIPWATSVPGWPHPIRER
jgi:hypothetical protein